MEEENKNVEEEVQTNSTVVVEETPVAEEVNRVSENKPKKKTPLIILWVLLGVGILLVVLCYVYPNFKEKPVSSAKTEQDNKTYYSEYRISGNSLENFDLYFLKLENEEKNKVYSPLSIKYALEMLGEGANGKTKEQIDAVIGDYASKSYPNNDHMSFANAMFIRNSLKENVKEEYTTNLVNKYGAEVLYEDFTSAKPMNDWISNKTFNLINDLLNDQKVSQESFLLINALGIDMYWTNQIHCATGSTDRVPCYNGGRYSVRYKHEKIPGSDLEYSKTVYPYSSENEFPPVDFNGNDNTKSADVYASYNRYDIIKELGEENIRKTVTDAYKEYLSSEIGQRDIKSGLAEPDVDTYINKFVEELGENYGIAGHTSDFMLYDDDNIKAFAKDLQEYNGVTLQYVGIMPKKESLKNYIDTVKVSDINTIISNLKELKIENFKEGVVTLIEGKIPLFKYEYELNLMEDLQKLGIKDVFDSQTADLSGMLKESKGTFIDDASHKANIEFSNEGIKASAVTSFGGAGSTSGGFNYLFEVPVEEIDITFDKPYLYFIRDKATGEVWFTGTVYEGIERAVPKNITY